MEHIQLPPRNAVERASTPTRRSPYPSPTSSLTSESADESTGSWKYQNRVGFDIMTSEDLPTYSFTLHAKSEGYVRTRRSRSFLVATDLANYSDFALEWVIENLVDDGDEIIILRVVTDDINEKSKSGLRRQEEKARENANNVRDRVLRRVGKRKINIVIEFMVGKVQDTIHAMIDMYQPSMLVTGTRGRSPVKGFLMGSVSSSILQSSPIPVIVVRPENKLRKAQEKARQRTSLTGRGVRYLKVDKMGSRRRRSTGDPTEDTGEEFSRKTQEEANAEVKASRRRSDSLLAAPKSELESTMDSIKDLDLNATKKTIRVTFKD
ncbi:hypothetical protein BZG36_04091 [Bifiguratus adelaidae]|uniref:UspA domain-containing protein n=1 Tax=Bifiguratus adelaidae TaxID=1938954 RepID=A0A261XWX5_9FUNG|nr:hypothetical protein BZG36_04091 [Bifiguratus adelaidae]